MKVKQLSSRKLEFLSNKKESFMNPREQYLDYTINLKMFFVFVDLFTFSYNFHAHPQTIDHGY